jgi:hypothetical protein
MLPRRTSCHTDVQRNLYALRPIRRRSHCTRSRQTIQRPPRQPQQRVQFVVPVEVAVEIMRLLDGALERHVGDGRGRAMPPRRPGWPTCAGSQPASRRARIVALAIRRSIASVATEPNSRRHTCIASRLLVRCNGAAVGACCPAQAQYHKPIWPGRCCESDVPHGRQQVNRLGEYAVEEWGNCPVMSGGAEHRLPGPQWQGDLSATA